MNRVLFSLFLTVFLCSSFKNYPQDHKDSAHLMMPQSPLADGDLYKISVDLGGIYKLDYNYIKNELGVTNIDNKDPRNIQLFGFGGGMLDEHILSTTPQTIKEISIYISGEQDGKFDPGDYILLYAQGPDHRTWNTTDGMLSIKKNLFSRTAQYVIKFSNAIGARVNTIANQTIVARDTINQYLDVQHVEDEKINLLSGRQVTYGSGKQWYGDLFKVTRKKDYSNLFKFQNLVLPSVAKFKVGFAARSDETTELIIQNNSVKNKLQLLRTNTGDVEDDVARESQGVFSIPVESASSIVLDYPNTSGASEGWLNYITLNTWHKLSWVGGSPIYIYNPNSRNISARYVVGQASSNLEVWDIINPLQPNLIQFKLENGNLTFDRLATDKSETFVLFDKTSTLPSPRKGPKLANQNLVGMTAVEAIILYHSEFESAAKRLATHRNQYSKIKTVPILIDHVFLEFGAGQADPTAIRNFAQAIYTLHPNFKYLVLLGDGSYDYLGHNPEIKKESFIPVYETDESLSPIYAFPSDDYFALLEPGEGGQDLLGDMDIAVGRIPVRTKEESDAIIQKIIQYDLAPAVQSDWKLRVAFSADDEDGNVHLDQSEEIATGVEKTYPELNIQKIYLDAFKQEAGAAGEIIPGATQSLYKNVFQGLLVFNYLGHGGPKGLSQEGLLRNSDVESWSNKARLPLCITATCSFAPYDDPLINSTGEELFRSTYGGAIALFTTVRNVYSSSNKILTQAVFNHLFTKDADAKSLSLGEVMRRAKNNLSFSGSDQLNARKFALLGDPIQRLSVPDIDIQTTQINNKPVISGQKDTIRSLQLLSIQGQVVDKKNQSLIPFFDGNVTVTLFDKKTRIKTLGQNSDSYPREFQVQNSVLFKGNAQVKNGVFKIEFVVPKDIDYSFGIAKISYYATSKDSLEAAGVYEQLIVGGSQQQLVDSDIPKINLHINHLLFKDGDETHANPFLLVDLFDENGINATGNSIGHDLVAILDDKKQYVLNSFYESVQGNYKQGKVAFPFSNLAPGPHQLKVRAWDVANNSGEAVINFVVLDPKIKSKILSLSVHPNPIKNQVFVHLVHNLTTFNGAKIKYSITTLSGQLIGTKEDQLSPAPVTTWLYQFPESTPAGTYIIISEIWNNGKMLDARGIKILRIP